jgi:S-adenosylmethionine decarboxylase proenzyme
LANVLGRHLLVDLFGCDRTRLDDVDYLRGQAVAAAEAMGATVVGVHAHRFQPHGVSVFLVLAESHLAIHTWPEHATASLDIFVCSQETDPHRGKTHLADCLRSDHAAEIELERGQLDSARTRRWRHAALAVSTPGTSIQE